LKSGVVLSFTCSKNNIKEHKNEIWVKKLKRNKSYKRLAEKD